MSSQVLDNTNHTVESVDNLDDIDISEHTNCTMIAVWGFNSGEDEADKIGESYCFPAPSSPRSQVSTKKTVPATTTETPKKKKKKTKRKETLDKFDKLAAAQFDFWNK